MGNFNARKQDDDDDDDDLRGTFKQLDEVDVGVEFEGLHAITLNTVVLVDLEKQHEAAKKIQNAILTLQKSIPASEYMRGELGIGANGRIEPIDAVAEDEEDEEDDNDP